MERDPRQDELDDRLRRWESRVERRIREAMDEGAFQELPFQGQRLPLDDDRAAGSWGPAYRLLRNAGMAPPWIEADKDARELLARIERAIETEARAGTPGRSRRRDAFVRLVKETNAAITRLNVEAPSERQHRRLVDPSAELARFDASAG